MADPSFHEALLLVDVAGQGQGVRAAPLGATFENATFEQGWAKLYKAGDYYIDLALTPRAQTADLMGELLAASGDETVPQGRVTLLREGGEPLQAVLDPSGGFSLELDKAGRYRLEIRLGDETLSIRELKAD